MKTRVFKRNAFDILRSVLFPLLFTALIAFIAVYGLNEARRSSESESLRLLEEGLQRAIVACYAIEGSYPPTLQYIEDTYGVRVDKDKYAVFYEIWSPYIAPSFTIVELN